MLWNMPASYAIGGTVLIITIVGLWCRALGSLTLVSHTTYATQPRWVFRLQRGTSRLCSASPVEFAIERENVHPKHRVIICCNLTLIAQKQQFLFSPSGTMTLHQYEVTLPLRGPQ